MADTRFPRVNWVQIGVNFLSIIVPIAVALLVWGSSIEKRITRLEERSVTYVSNEVIAQMKTDLTWIRSVQIDVLAQQKEIIKAINQHMAEDR